MTNINKRYEKFHNDCKERLPHYEEYEFIIDFVKYRDKLKVKHLKCNHVYDVSPSNFIKGYKCPNCAGRVVNNNTVQNKLNEMHGKNVYILEDNYKNNKTKMRIYHSKCKSYFKANYSNLSLGHGCPNCIKNKKKSYNEIKDYIEKEEYSLISKNYKNSRSKLKIKHLDCGKEFLMNWESFYSSNHRCPFCSNVNNSKGTRKISKFLDENSIKYEKEKVFEDLLSPNKNNLRIDFFLEDYNLCIEYDGEQHFKPFNYKNGKEKFEKLKINDEIKNNYFDKHEKIDLIRINYKDFKNNLIEDKIRKYLEKRSTTIL